MFLQKLEVFEIPDEAPTIIWFWIISTVVALVLIDTQKLKGKVSILINFIIVFYAGFLLGGIPNVLIPIERTLNALSVRGDLSDLLHAYAIFGIIIGSSYLFGRIFCGYACPLGAIQELISKLNFKSDIKSQKGNRLHFNFGFRYATRIRWFSLGLLFFLSSIFSLSILPKIDPFSGFSYLKAFEIVLLVPFIALLIIGILSIFLYRPWCRFLCPFGAGSSFLAQHSAIKYFRTEDCTNCGLCEKVCPTEEAAAESKKGECYYCNRCIEICPHDAIIFDLSS
ncbi:MAG: 4Fe-4S binding protein [Candidatus Hodarchaeales archaeon]|jgi:polyferredoxin